MATLQECHDAVEALAAKLAVLSDKPRGIADRSLSCHVTDLHTTFSGHMRNGLIEDLTTEPAPKAQINLRLASDDLVALTQGQLHTGHALATGRLKIDASLMDLLRLKSMF